MKTQLLRSILIVAGLLMLFASVSPLHAADREQQLRGEYFYYVMGHGELLEDVCRENIDMTVQKCIYNLVRYNKLDSKLIRPGTQIKLPVKWLREAIVGVEISSAFGQVYYKELKDKTWQAMNVNKKRALFVGEELLTKYGNANLLFHDGSRANVGQHTHLKITELSVGGKSTGKIRLSLQKGSLKNKIRKQQQEHFEIDTPRGVASVRGTDFRLRLSEDGDMFNETLEGAVAVSNEKSETLVDGNFGVKIDTAQQMSDKTKLLDAPSLVDMSSDNDSFRLVRLKWSAVVGAKYFVYELYSGERLLLKDKTKKHELSLSVLEAGDYRIIIKAVDSQGFEGNEAQYHFSVSQ